MGATSPSTALAAMAASMALPPCSRMRAPICEASTLSLATTPAPPATRDLERSRSSAAGSGRGASAMALIGGMVEDYRDFWCRQCGGLNLELLDGVEVLRLPREPGVQLAAAMSDFPDAQPTMNKAAGRIAPD